MHISFNMFLNLLIIVTSSLAATPYDFKAKYVAAVNCGGSETIGAHNIIYDEDYLLVGTASDFGSQFAFMNAHPDDASIYKTERWHSETFGYKIPVNDGNYVIMLKFSEVYFQSPRQKIFDVKVNGIAAVKNLDIWETAGGTGLAHDIYIPVKVRNGQITVNRVTVAFKDTIDLDFVKGLADNPKINAFAVIEGTLEDMPPTPMKHGMEENEDDDDEDLYEQSMQLRRNNEVRQKLQEEAQYVQQQKEKESQRARQPEDNLFDEEEQFVVPEAQESKNPFDNDSDFKWVGIVLTVIIVIPVAYFIQNRL